MTTTSVFQQLIALSLAAVVTAGILLGHDGLAHHYAGAASQQAGVWAKAPALPASASRGAALQTTPGSCPAPSGVQRVLA